MDRSNNRRMTEAEWHHVASGAETIEIDGEIVGVIEDGVPVWFSNAGDACPSSKTAKATAPHCTAK